MWFPLSSELKCWFRFCFFDFWTGCLIKIVDSASFVPWHKISVVNQFADLIPDGGFWHPNSLTYSSWGQGKLIALLISCQVEIYNKACGVKLSVSVVQITLFDLNEVPLILVWGIPMDDYCPLVWYSNRHFQNSFLFYFLYIL